MLDRVLPWFDVSVVAAPLEIVYHPPDASSPAAGLALGATKLKKYSENSRCIPGNVPSLKKRISPQHDMLRFDVSVVAAPLEIAYHPPDAGSLAAGLALGAASARYTGRLLLNRPAPQPLPPGASAIARKREAARTATAALLTDVAAEDLRLAFGGAPASPPPAQARPRSLLCHLGQVSQVSGLRVQGSAVKGRGGGRCASARPRARPRQSC